MALETSAAVRAFLIDALRLDLIGPSPDDLIHASETIPQTPSRWYLSGFLVPYEAKLRDRSDSDSNDSFDPQITKPSNGDDEKAPEAASARKGHFPSSMGLSFLFAPGTKHIDVVITWGDYEPIEIDEANTEADTNLQARTGQPWHRTPRQTHLSVSLSHEPKTVEQRSLLPIDSKDSSSPP